MENLSGFGPGILIVPVVVGLAALWIGSLVSIFRRSSAMSGLELIAWSAFVVFAQLIGPLIWFSVGRERYAASPPAR
jgi:FtsH-binding integral membrane protein